MGGMRGPGTAMPMGTAMGGRMMTGRPLGTAAGGAGEDVRPMTSVKGAGFQSKPKAGGAGSFDPLNQASRGPAPPLAEKSENSAEDQAKEMEKQVNRLMEESATLAAVKGDLMGALDKAKECGKRERQLCKLREQNGLMEAVNLDLTYASLFNLASCYQKNKMWSEALSTYSLIVKNKQYVKKRKEGRKEQYTVCCVLCAVCCVLLRANTGITLLLLLLFHSGTRTLGASA